MAKLYFKYGAMGSSKTAQVLITKFNYEERGMKVWLLKPATDNRDGENMLISRIGLSSECLAVGEEESIMDLFLSLKSAPDVIIADESQFFTCTQIDEFRRIVDDYDTPVLCFGLRTDFRAKMFSGSGRLFEIADSIAEIKTICACGSKATVNARIGENGKIVTHGHKIMLGGNDKYIAMCYKCWQKRIREESEDAGNNS